MSISSIGALGGISPMRLDLLDGTRRVGGAGRAAEVTGIGGTSGSDAGTSFSDMVMRALDKLNTVQQTADTYAQQAATGTLQSVEDYMAASTESQLMTQLTVAVRNKALEAYNDISKMVV